MKAMNEKKNITYKEPLNQSVFQKGHSAISQFPANQYRDLGYEQAVVLHSLDAMPL
ncbi:hypothetical protein A2U01_0093172 [Trifolium medium]|uniref:Uncharacterized protein n=1 Tax=Trifolium medium TaxID=97028 RepID=A0A392UEE2_9FABA|nr:hypothetical protein [Trifolium medium]